MDEHHEHNLLIQFAKLAWEKPAPGIEQKIHANGNKRMRLLRFLDNYVEGGWCSNGHVGFVVRGEMKIDFDNGLIKSYQQGDGLWIEDGEQSKHSVLIEKGKFVELIMFEDN